MLILTVRGSTLVVRIKSDVYKRQILSTKVDPRAVRVMYNRLLVKQQFIVAYRQERCILKILKAGKQNRTRISMYCVKIPTGGRYL